MPFPSPHHQGLPTSQRPAIIILPLLLITSPCHEVALGLHGCSVISAVESLSSPGRLIYFFCLDCLEGSVDLGTRTLYSQMHAILGITGLPCLVGEIVHCRREIGRFSVIVSSVSSLFCV